MAPLFPVKTRRLWIVAGILLAAALLAPPAGGAAPAGLPAEIDGIPVADAFVPLDAETIGTVRSLRGRLIVRHGRRFSAYEAKVGDRLYVHDVLFTLEGGRTRIGLDNGDVATLGENSRISLDDFENDRREGRKRSVFGVLKGKAMFYAIRLFGYRSVTNEVHTPTAVVGVRGTKYGVKVEDAEDVLAAASGPVYLAAAGPPPPGLLAQADPVAPPTTTVYGFDGEVTVTSTLDDTTTTVGPGQNVSVGTEGAGPVVVTPPEEAQAFASDTEAPPPGEGGTGDAGEAEGGGGETGGGEADGGEGGEDGNGDTGEDDGAGTTDRGDGGEEGDTVVIDTTTDTTLVDADTSSVDATRDTTTSTLTTEATTVVSGADVGYFSALLTRSYGALSLADVYTNKSRSDFSGTAVKGTSIVDGTGFLTASDTADADEAAPYITRINTAAGGPFDSGDLGTTRQMDNPDNTGGLWPEADNPLGQNSYMEWGYWRMSTWVADPVSGASYAITDRAYYIDGIATPDSVAPGVVGTYGGSAWGTYWSGGGGTDMIGSFYCTVDGPARTVTDFNLSVSGGGKSASILGASGGFVGTSGEFQITAGTFKVNNGVSDLPAATRSCTGSLFGPAGENVGGAWAMDAQTGNHDAAVGIFQGAKGAQPSTPATFPSTMPPVSPP